MWVWVSVGKVWKKCGKELCGGNCGKNVVNNNM
jgi:hypothetical protein